MKQMTYLVAALLIASPALAQEGQTGAETPASPAKGADISASVTATATRQGSEMQIDLSGTEGWTCSGKGAATASGQAIDDASGSGSSRSSGGGSSGSSRSSGGNFTRNTSAFASIRLACSDGRTGNAMVRGSVDKQARISFKLSDRSRGSADVAVN